MGHLGKGARAGEPEKQARRAAAFCAPSHLAMVVSMTMSPGFKASPRNPLTGISIENGNKLGNRPVVRQSKICAHAIHFWTAAR